MPQPTPDIPIERTWLDAVLDAIAFLGVLTAIVVVAADWAELPERIPSHFNLAGRVDGHGGKGLLILLPVIAALLFAGMTAVARLPACWNLLYPPSKRQYQLVHRLVNLIKCLAVWLLADLCRQAVQVGLSERERLNGVPMFALIGAILCAVIWYLFAARRAAG